MAVLFRSCLLCSLRTACFLIAIYTFVLAILLLVFNVHDYYYASNYIAWSRILSFVFAVALFFAGVCLFSGLLRNSRSLHALWLLIFVAFIIYQIAAVSWNLYYYTDAYAPIPASIRSSTLSNIVVFGLSIFLNILCVVTVHSHRETVVGF